MDEQLKALFPWLGTQAIEYAPGKNAEVKFKELGDVTLGYGFNVNNQSFVFVPESYLQKGVQVKDRQVYSANALRPEFEQQIAPYSKIYTTQELEQLTGQQKFQKDYSKGIYSDTRGYLIPESLVKEYLIPAQNYQINEVTPEGFVFGPIAGPSVNESGQKFYSIQAGGRLDASAWITPDALYPKGQYTIPGEKWYESNLAKLGFALIAGGTAGLALGGAGAGGAAAGGAAGTGAAAGGTAAAGGAGIVGTPGVSTIFPVAAPVAPTVTSIAPIATAGGAALGAFTPAPGSLQAALPGMGVETAASAGGFTAAPGSFQAALPGLGIASAPSLAGNLATSSGISATDALRIANQARGLLGAGQNPIVPQQQGLPQQAGGSQGVDYSGLLSLLQLQAKTPGVSSLTQPAQLRQMYQPTLLPDVLSLLG